MDNGRLGESKTWSITRALAEIRVLVYGTGQYKTRQNMGQGTFETF